MNLLWFSLNFNLNLVDIGLVQFYNFNFKLILNLILNFNFIIFNINNFNIYLTTRFRIKFKVNWNQNQSLASPWCQVPLTNQNGAGLNWTNRKFVVVERILERRGYSDNSEQLWELSNILMNSKSEWNRSRLRQEKNSHKTQRVAWEISVRRRRGNGNEW